MQCQCGFVNAPDARFCGQCRAMIGDPAIPALPPLATVISTAAEPVAPARPLPVKWLTALAAAVALAFAGYWWSNRPPQRYKPDNSGLYPILANGKYGFIDRSGKTVIDPQFDQALPFSEGMARVRVGTKWGYIDKKGALTITPQFDFAYPFQYKRAAVQQGRLWGFIDADGKFIGTPDYRWAGQFSGDFAPVQTSIGRLAFINHVGEAVLPGKIELTPAWTTASGLGFAAGLAPAASGKGWGYLDTTGQWAIPPQYENAFGFAEGAAPVQVGGRWGFIDQRGKFVVNPQYDTASEFYEGYARVGNGGKVGFLDRNGRVAIALKFNGTGNFSNGLAPVRTADGWGFIATSGKMTIAPQYDTADEFQNGLARVTALGKEAYITTSGSFVIDPFPGTTLRAEKDRLASEAGAHAAPATRSTPVVAESAAPATSGSIPPSILGVWRGGFTCGAREHTIEMNIYPSHSVTVARVFVAGIGAALYNVSWNEQSSSIHATPDHEVQHIVQTTWLNIDGRYDNGAIQGSVATCGTLRMSKDSGSAAQAAVKPSFDCRIARTSIEKAICSDIELATLELRMVAAYNGALASASNGNERKAIQEEHMQWFREYTRSCGGSVGAALNDCVGRKLAEHHAMLRAQTSRR